MEAEAPLSGDSGVLRGEGTPRALSRRDRAPGPRETPRVISGPRHSGCCSLSGLLPWGLVLLARAQVPHRSIPFGDTKDGSSPIPSWSKALELWDTEVEAVTLPFKWFCTNFTELKLPGPSEQPRGRVGKCLPKLDFWSPGAALAGLPMGESVPVPGSGPAGPAALGGKPWPAPHAGPGSLDLPCELCICGGVRPS